MNDLLKVLAPLLGTAIAGPFGTMAASFLADKLGVQEKTIAAVQDVLTSSTMTPDQITSIRQAEIEFKKWMADSDIKREQLAVDNTKDARAMQVSTKSYMPAALTCMITAGFFSVLGWMLYDKAAVDNPPLLIMLGSLGTAWTAACSFWFGTTSNSKAKTDMLANSTPGK